MNKSESLISIDWGFGPRRKITYPLFGDGIFTQEGEAWKHSRELLRPQFTYRQYSDLEILREPIDDLITCISDSESGVVDLQPLFFRFTLDTTTAFLFGESIRSLKAGSKAARFEEAFDSAQSTVAMRFRLLDLYWLIGGRKFSKACDEVHKFTEDILERAMSSQSSGEKRESRYVFLDAIAKEYPDRTALRHQMLNILIAGRDTTACLLSWTLYVFHRIFSQQVAYRVSSYLLVRHPRVLSKLRTEIASVLSSTGSITRTDLKKMAYLTNVLKESMYIFSGLEKLLIF